MSADFLVEITLDHDEFIDSCPDKTQAEVMRNAYAAMLRRNRLADRLGVKLKPIMRGHRAVAYGLYVGPNNKKERS